MSTAIVGGPPPSWLASIGSTASVRIRPGPQWPVGLCTVALLGWGVPVVLGGSAGLRVGWVVLAAVAGIGALALALRGSPLVGLVPLALGGLAWGLATGDQTPASAGDIPGLARLVGWNLAYAVPLLLAYVAAVWVDARWHLYRKVRSGVLGRRWWLPPERAQAPDGVSRQWLGLLEAIPSARFVVVSAESTLVVAGRRVAVVRSVVWPAGQYTIAGDDALKRNRRAYALGGEDLAGLATDARIWSERLEASRAQCRGYLVVHPKSERPIDDIELDLPPQVRAGVLAADELVEVIGAFLASEAHWLDAPVLQRLDEGLHLFGG